MSPSETKGYDEAENKAVSSKNDNGRVKNERIVENLLHVQFREKQAGKDK